jgi:hypothetical protein
MLTAFMDYAIEWQFIVFLKPRLPTDAPFGGYKETYEQWIICKSRHLISSDPFYY